MIYILLVNYNQWENTIECLDSITRNSNHNYKIILVDNASKNESADKIILWLRAQTIQFTLYKKEKDNTIIPIDNEFEENITLDSSNTLCDVELSRISFVINNSNRGLADAWNIATSLLGNCNYDDYVWYLGSDTVIPSDTINVLYSYISMNPNIRAFGTTSLFYYDKERIQCCGLGYGSSWLGVYKHLFQGKIYKEINDNTLRKKLESIKSKNRYIYGNSMIFKFDVIKQVFPFCVDYFIYYEELDIMQKLESQNIDIGICYKCLVYHKEGGTIRANGNIKNPLSEYYFLRNSIIFTKKYFPYKIFTIYLVSILRIINRIRKGYYKIALMMILILFNPAYQFEEFKKRNEWLNL